MFEAGLAAACHELDFRGGAPKALWISIKHYNPFVVETEGNGKVSSPRPLDTGGVAYNRPNSSTPGLASLRSTRAARRKQALGQQDAIKRDYAAWRGRPTNRTPPDGS